MYKNPRAEYLKPGPLKANFTVRLFSGYSNNKLVDAPFGIPEEAELVHLVHLEVFRGGAHTADDDHPPLLALQQHIGALSIYSSDRLRRASMSIRLYP